MISSVPLVGPLFEAVRGMVSFLVNPVNLITLGGIGIAFVALKKFFDESPAGEFFKKSLSDMYTFMTDTLGKIVSFFTKDEITGQDIRDKIKNKGFSLH